MLYDNTTHQSIHIKSNKELSDHMKRSCYEKLEVLPHKGHKFFSIEERATIKGLNK